MWRYHKSYDAPIRLSVVNGQSAEVNHPRLIQALNAIVEAADNTEGLENFLTVKLAGPTSPDVWQISISHAGYDPYDAAATYKRALREAGIPIPPVAPVGRLDKVRAYYERNELEIPAFLKRWEEER